MDERTKRIVRAIFGLKSTPPTGSQHYRSGWDDGLEAAIDVAKGAAAQSTEQPATLADVLRGAADRVDAEDVPQTADDVADFVDGVRWATAQLRRIAGEADAGPAGDATPDWLADLARRYATGLNSAERATLRFALELAEDQMLSRGNEFAAVDFAALESLKQRAGGGAAEPGYTESADYQVVGDWGVDGADSAEGARAAVAKWLRAYPKCGARAEQRIVRDWPDGSEYYGPWTPLDGD